MKYSLDASVLEIQRRRDERLRKRSRRRVGALSGSTALLAALLIWKSVVPESAAGTAVILAGLIGGFSAGLSAAGEEGGTLLRAAARQFAGAGAAWAPDSVYGAFLLSPAAGGYVLAGVIAFAAGIAVTVLCIARREGQRRKQSRAPEPERYEEEK